MKKQPIRCGWCMTGQHDSCPGCTRNGDGTLIFCTCAETDKCGRLRCTECFEDNPEHVGSDGHCLDTMRCQGRQDLSVRIARKNLGLDDESVSIEIYSRKNHLKEMDMARTAANKKATSGAPAKKTVKKAPEKGINFLIEQVKAKTGIETNGAALRVILRKLVKDGEIERGEGRWEFSGVKDPAVVAVIKAIKSGELEKKNKDGVAAAKKASPKKTKKKVEEEPVSDDEEFEDAELEDVEEDTEEDTEEDADLELEDIDLDDEE